MVCLWFVNGILEKWQRSRKCEFMTSRAYTKLWLLTASLSIERGYDF